MGHMRATVAGDLALSFVGRAGSYAQKRSSCTLKHLVGRVIGKQFRSVLAPLSLRKGAECLSWVKQFRDDLATFVQCCRKAALEPSAWIEFMSREARWTASIS